MINSDKVSYVLMTTHDKYFVEYLLEYLVIADSISEAMEFNSYDEALKFKSMLLDRCKINFNISTFIK
jgi:hypothetical protein